MALSWVRSWNSVPGYQVGKVLLGRLSNGQTYVRIHFRWGFYGDTAAIVDMDAVATNILTFGIVTTFGDGTETPPNPLDTPNDVAPPTERWLYWEPRAPVPRVMSGSANVIGWTDGAINEETDIKSQVLATGVPAGQTLNLWASWGAPNAWDSTGNSHVWAGASVLYKH